MFFPSSQEMRDADAGTIRSKNLSSFELMLHASSAIAHEMIKKLPPSDIFFICGPGNNGGDGLCVASILSERGFRVRVHLIKDDGISRTSENIDAERLLSKDNFKTEEDFISELSKFPESTLVDAVLGIGQKNPPRERYKGIISKLRFHKKIWSIDSPTGINVDTGEVFEPHFNCERTFAVQANKRGLTQYPARLISGEITIVDAGIDIQKSEFSLLEPIKLSSRSPFSHKGDIGPVFLIAGSTQMPGALEFAAEGALAGGASLISAYDFSTSLQPNVIRLSTSNHKYFSKFHLAECLEKIKVSKSFVCGPGLGLEPATKDFLFELLKNASQDTPGVVDADAISLCAQSQKFSLLKGRVITPHPGEAASLLSISTSEVQIDRFQSAKAIAELTGSIVVLKGAGSIVYDPSQMCGFVCLEGSASLGIGGSGDVLAGIIGAFLARGLSTLDAAKLGVYIHAKAGSNPNVIFKSPIEIAEKVHQLLFECT